MLSKLILYWNKEYFKKRALLNYILIIKHDVLRKNTNDIKTTHTPKLTSLVTMTNEIKWLIIFLLNIFDIIWKKEEKKTIYCRFSTTIKLKLI